HHQHLPSFPTRRSSDLAQTYVYTLTRALLPNVKSPIATLFLGPILGSDEVNSGKTATLTGIKAIDDSTLQITLKQPTAYFLQVLDRKSTRLNSSHVKIS